MKSPAEKRTHGGVRGANLSRSSVLFGGPFGRIFRSLASGDYGPDDAVSQANLALLAIEFQGADDVVKDAPDGEEGGIPAVYTYLGQFIDHDLTFDPASSLQKQNDPDALVDYRTPRFDLDNVYGRGPDDQPYFYQKGGRLFALGKPLEGATPLDSSDPRKGMAAAFDLPRNGEHPARALIGDPRNDENMIVSQLQGLWHRFHNAIAEARPHWSFSRIQQEVRFCYQYILVHDFLPRLIATDVLEAILPGSRDGEPDVTQMKLTYFHPKDEAFMPLEFSAAAYRFGHSMVRIGYRLNDHHKFFIFDMKSRALRGFDEISADKAIDWRRFIDITPLYDGTDPPPPDAENAEGRLRLQAAYKMDTSLVNPLASLPTEISDIPASGCTVPNPLAELNLRRGWRMRLPTGQSVAKAMGLVPRPDEQINFGKKTGDDKNDKLKNVTQVAGGAFNGNLPLWAYVLAETVACNTNVKVLKSGAKIGSTDPNDLTTVPRVTYKLGPVGGTIVGETFLGILRADSSSYVTLDPCWTPSGIVDGTFGLRELIKIALGITELKSLPPVGSFPNPVNAPDPDIKACVGSF